MDLSQIEEIKRLAIISAFADDSLMETLVLKGGNALDIIYQVANRASIDLDFSIETDLEPIDVFSTKINRALTMIFGERGYIVFDVEIKEKPRIRGANTPESWGGYRLYFKIIEKDKYIGFKEDIGALRRNATVVGLDQAKKFSIDISKWEYCEKKQSFELEGYTIYAYSPEMIVLEKLRAICQQMPDYVKKIGKSCTARARDFFDIHTVLEHFDIDLTSSENIDLLRRIFKQKDVSLSSIAEIKDYREYHRIDFAAVQDTVKPQVELRDYDFYFDYVIDKCGELLKTLGEV